MFSRFYTRKDVGFFKIKYEYKPIEINLDCIQYIEESKGGARIVWGQSISGIFPTNISAIDSTYVREKSMVVTASYMQVLEELRRADRASQPDKADQFLVLNDRAINLAGVATIAERGSKEAIIEFAAIQTSLTIRMTQDEIRRRAPKCFLPILASPAPR